MSEMNWKTRDEADQRDDAERRQAPRRTIAPKVATVDTIEAWKKEIAGYYSTMYDFIDTDAIKVFQDLSQFSARASEMRSRIGATASKDWQNFRIRVIDPFIEECDRQFKLHSRITAIQEMDARLAGGKFA